MREGRGEKRKGEEGKETEVMGKEGKEKEGKGAGKGWEGIRKIVRTVEHLLGT